MKFISMLLLLFLVTVSAAGAQRPDPRSPEAKVRWQQRCAQAERSLARNELTDREAMLRFTLCPAVGAMIIPRQWTPVERDSVDLANLIYASRLLHDERVTDAVLAVVANRSAPRETRVAALTVLANHLVPEYWVNFGEIRYTVVVPAGGGATTRHETGAIVSVGPTPTWIAVGDRPVTQAVRERVLNALREMLQEDDEHYMLVAIRNTIDSGVAGR
jgi:hypothetical protein